MSVRTSSSSFHLVIGLVVFGLAFHTGCGFFAPKDSSSENHADYESRNVGSVTKQDDPIEAMKRLPPHRQRILRVTQSEQLLQTMSGKMKLLAKSFRETTNASSFSFGEIDYVGIEPSSFDEQLDEMLDHQADIVVFHEWPILQESAKATLGDVWQPILSVRQFEDSQIGVLRGYFSADYKTFTMETKFEGRLHLDGERRCGVKAWQTLTWEEDQPDDWKLTGWKQSKLKLVAGNGQLFTNVTKQLIPDQKTFETVSHSSQEAMIVKRSGEVNVNLSIKDIDADYSWFSDWESTSQYPSVSVVDFDNDGDDDIFLTDRWQSPQLLRNEGDLTFVDATGEVGLEGLGKFVNCGYFFDYDNDGDADLLIGYSVKQSRFFENEAGTFVPNETINKALKDVRMVVSVAGADVNRDGLLDLYLCTYTSPSGKMDDWIKHVARPQDRVKTRLRIERSNRYVDRGGPPNILLINRGNTFEWANVSDDLKQYRCSYQASWSDFDNDGDQDLYVCNDFSADVFLRNDTQRGSGQPKFVDVTTEIAPTVKMGFGMGSSYGDYDNDGDLDLYVCNMYSKAGNRIIKQLEDVDERLAVSARGNFLYENLGGTFQQIAGDDVDQQHINVVGWSFGGQFADFDNDGQLDLFVPSGFYSAPQEIKTDLDL
ncbi:MAG: VCBS repeat-containing protein [Planctomycetota bacterium]